jgi:hypothetical protein
MDFAVMLYCIGAAFTALVLLPDVKSARDLGWWVLQAVLWLPLLIITRR